jgi:hypothetical protein
MLLDLARWLTFGEQERWDRATSDLLHLWLVGGEDIY